MLVKCPDCGTLVSDKASKCPKCGKIFVQKAPAPLEYEGIIKILNKVNEIRSKFPHFWAKLSVFPDNFSMTPIIEVLTERDANTAETGSFSVMINEEDLRKTNLITGFEALDYHDKFTSDSESHTWVKVNDTKMAAKIVYDLFTGVFKKNLESARLVITGVRDNSNKAKYNSAGDFLEGKGYGQGEFAYYKEPEEAHETQQEDESRTQQEDNEGCGEKAGCIIAIIIVFIFFLGFISIIF